MLCVNLKDRIYNQGDAMIDPNQIQDATSFIGDVIKVAQNHPLTAGAVGTWIAGEHALPFVGKIEANSMVQLIWSILKRLIPTPK